MRRFLYIALIFVFLLSLVACTGETLRDKPIIEKPIEDNSIRVPVEQSNNDKSKEDKPKEDKPIEDTFIRVEELSYNISLFNQLMDNEELVKNNFCVSPYSLKQALLLAYVGAENGSESQQELINLLDLIETGKSSIHELERDNRVILTSSESVKFKVANLALVDESLMKSDKFEDIFVKTLNDYYNAAVEMSDLQDVSIVNKVNNFADKNTEGTIQKFIDRPFVENTRLVLLNAVYFLGDWRLPFEGNATYSDIFYGLNGESNVDFMTGTKEVKYFENDLFKSISLEYKSDEGVVNTPNYEMSFYLPIDENANIVDLFKSLENKDELLSIGKEYKYLDTNIKLPKFEIETELNLTDVLGTMGMEYCLSPMNMDFTNIADVEKSEGFYISDVIQKTYIKVDEKGTEASAVTAVIMKDNMAMVITPKYKEFIADRPFIYIIKDTYTDTILFMGVISNL